MKKTILTGLRPTGNLHLGHYFGAGQNYVKSLFALGFQGFLIMVCVAIYAVLVHNVAFTDNIVESLWRVIGVTVLLCFTLFKTGSVAKSILHAH